MNACARLPLHVNWCSRTHTRTPMQYSLGSIYTRMRVCVCVSQQCNPHLECGSGGSFEHGLSRCLILVTRTRLLLLPVLLAHLPLLPACHLCQPRNTHTHMHTHNLVGTTVLLLYPVSFPYNCTFEMYISQARSDKLSNSPENQFFYLLKDTF